MLENRQQKSQNRGERKFILRKEKQKILHQPAGFIEGERKTAAGGSKRATRGSYKKRAANISR